jgi:hypothetical protein
MDLQRFLIAVALHPDVRRDASGHGDTLFFLRTFLLNLSESSPANRLRIAKEE